MIEKLPANISTHCPAGLKDHLGRWMVLPDDGQAGWTIESINRDLRLEDWYLAELSSIVWFGDDGSGNILGYSPDDDHVILWNSEDGPEPWRKDTFDSIVEFIKNDYN